MSDIITIQVTGTDELTSALEQLSNKMHDLHKPMSAIGSFISNIIEVSFDREESPDHQAWHPLAELTKLRKEKRGESKILQSSSRTLRESVGYKADDTSLIVGVNAYSKKGYPYPLVHQFGSKDGKIPARPFMPITQNGELYENIDKEVLDVLLEYLSK